MKGQTLPKLKTSVSTTLIYNIISRVRKVHLTNEFWEDRKRFDQFLRRYSEAILENIEKVTGGKWQEAEITIYLIPPDSPVITIPLPLILKLRKDSLFTLHLLIHELVHRFLLVSFTEFRKEVSPEYIGLTQHEALTEYITKVVEEKIFGKQKAQLLLKKEHSMITSRNSKECERLVNEFEKKWDLKKHPLVWWLKHQKSA